ncbi:MAG TPA: cysteine rich repeat-containing protein [Burkholderiales bacterium]|nr:cysteine rich repeat-containing protein [Burkholderiales bacterium]
MSIRNAVVSTAFALLAAGLAAGASAQDSAKAGKASGPCAEDAKKFCGDEKPGGGRIARCMKRHESELSPACQGQMKKAEERLEQVKEECNADAKKFCKGIRPGQGRILACLKSHQSELAPACAAEFNRAKK